MTVLSFTGTRRGLTPEQVHVVAAVLREGWTELVHGDCVGADSDVHALAVALGLKVKKRPCTLTQQRAFTEGGEVVTSPKPPLARNRDIVDDGVALLACPGEMHEERRSGTWATVRYARQQGRPVTVVWPNGETTTKGPDWSPAPP